MSCTDTGLLGERWGRGGVGKESVESPVSNTGSEIIGGFPHGNVCGWLDKCGQNHRDTAGWETERPPCARGPRLPEGGPKYTLGCPYHGKWGQHAAEATC